MAIRDIATIDLVAEAGGGGARFHEVQNYLVHFGYLAPETFRIGLLDEVTEDALRSFQRFYGLDPHGKFSVSTRSLMEKPRCALEDPLEEGPAVPLKCEWEVPGPLTYRLISNPPSPVTLQDALDALVDAARRWNDHSSLKLQLASGTAANIEIGWLQDAASYGPVGDGKIASAEYPPNCGLLLSSAPRPVRFDVKLRWAFGGVKDRYDIMTVALHELGHVLGLAHSGLGSSIMYAFLPIGKQKFLGQEDRIAIRSAYP